MASSTDPAPRAFVPHDHRTCRRRSMAAVEAACAARRLRLTPARRFALECLLESHRALTAYELLEKLAAAGLGGQPPVVYRALEFLVENGFAHRIERLAAFAACSCVGAEHHAGFLVCRACRRVAETAMARPSHGLAAASAAAGFAIERTVTEAEGLCSRCRAAAA